MNVVWTCSFEMHLEQAARTYSMDMQDGHVGLTCGMNMRSGNAA